MKKELEQRYIPASYGQDMSEKIASFAGGAMSVAEYSDDFHTLSSRAEVNEPKYITGQI